MTLQQLWTRGEFVVTPAGATGMVRAFDRRTNMVVMQMGALGMLEALTGSIRKSRGERSIDLIDWLREQGMIQDHHFTKLRLGEQP